MESATWSFVAPFHCIEGNILCKSKTIEMLNSSVGVSLRPCLSNFESPSPIPSQSLSRQGHLLLLDMLKVEITSSILDEIYLQLKPHQFFP